MMSKYILLIGMLSFMLLGCNSDSTNPTDGDSDASELELEAETDSGEIDITDTSSDGDESDAELDAVEDDSIDGDDDIDEVEDELDSDFIDNDAVEAEEEIEVEQVVYPPTVIETLPYDELTVTACATKNPADDVPPATEVNRLVWGDDDGLMYFVDRSYLGSKKSESKSDANFVWIYNEAEKTFTCDLALSQTAFAMDGLNTDSGTVIWLAQKNRLAKRTPAGEWLYFDIPDAPMPVGYHIAGGIQVDNTGWVAVWGRWGIVFYNESTDTWKKFDLPDFLYQPAALHGNWHSNKFYLPVVCKVLSWEIGTDSLIEEVTIDGCDESSGDALYVINKVDNNLEMAQVNWKTIERTYGALQKTVTLALDTKTQNTLGVVDLSFCRYSDCLEYNYDTHGPLPGRQKKATLHMVPGMTGTPPATVVSALDQMESITVYEVEQLNIFIRLGPSFNEEAGKCSCGQMWITNIWGIPFTPPGYPAEDVWGYFSNPMWKMFTTSFWRDGETLWLGSTRVAQDLSE